MLHYSVSIMINMTLDEAIEHCKEVAKEQENCNVGCSLEHRQLAIWLSALKAITENNYSTKRNMKSILSKKTRMEVSKAKCQPKVQHDFTIKGVKIMAASKKDAIKKYNHRKK